MTKTAFDKLAESIFQIDPGPTYSVTALDNDRLISLDDVQNDIEVAYEQWIESLKFWPISDVVVWQLEGISAEDITKHFIETYVDVCAKRGLKNIFEKDRYNGKL